MQCKPGYLYVNGFLEIRILSQAKNPKFSYPLLQKRIESHFDPVSGVTYAGKYLYSGSPSRNNLLVELEKHFAISIGKYHITNLFDVCVFGGNKTVEYKNVKSNTVTSKTVAADNGILIQTNNKMCLLSEIKYDEHFFRKINNLGNILCR
jgi:hypothetical protein